MAKILTDKELGNIIWRETGESGNIDDSDQYMHFLEDLGQLICDHFGGDVGVVGYDEFDGLGWTIGFHINESVPADGGVFKDYDADVIWKDGEEEQL